ncbi:hypothetical protein BD311DRAFT_764279 [Dichomitus squalens]|uniref:Uncharacterized protein n=1 Tax=Dichomitus squalens TaxID=114155 RepID=A0A4Q9ME39_9APHY|nr:hypothetical protein BD311DRAFT_764279 [Dichomitus squalens]
MSRAWKGPLQDQTQSGNSTTIVGSKLDDVECEVHIAGSIIIPPRSVDSVSPSTFSYQSCQFGFLQVSHFMTLSIEPQKPPYNVLFYRQTTSIGVTSARGRDPQNHLLNLDNRQDH